MSRSQYEAMRTDAANWTLGVLYACDDDPRVVVKQRLPLGWAWNFAHPWAYPAIGAAILALLGPPLLAWYFQAHAATLIVCGALSLAAVVWMASRLARNPGEESP